MLEIPAHGVMAVLLDIQHVDYLSPDKGGRLGGVSAGFPLWKLEASLQNMSFDAADIWITFRDRCRGVKRPWLAMDHSRPFPRHFSAGFARSTKPDGTPFTGAAATWSQAIDDDGDAVLTMTGLPRGMRLALRDYVGFRWDAAGSDAGANDRRALVRVVEAATADGDGEIAVKVQPAVPTLVPEDAVAHLDRPACVMRLVTAESQMSPIAPGYVPAGGTIVGVQDLRP